ncbi:hypothetical protein HNP84_010026 [Thermocatellispora tengchongensis]|uniref:Uncharacterized protein n=1 Tax=Thermocatellispora tengchongensis TaxID=1073253 RepID=A0A840PMU4_9ACTN|nr:hypothetical protein [Thermocatellispora tengchongensis]
MQARRHLVGGALRFAPLCAHLVAVPASRASAHAVPRSGRPQGTRPHSSASPQWERARSGARHSAPRPGNARLAPAHQRGGRRLIGACARREPRSLPCTSGRRRSPIGPAARHTARPRGGFQRSVRGMDRCGCGPAHGAPQDGGWRETDAGPRRIAAQGGRKRAAAAGFALTTCVCARCAFRHHPIGGGSRGCGSSGHRPGHAHPTSPRTGASNMGTPQPRPRPGTPAPAPHVRPSLPESSQRERVTCRNAGHTRASLPRSPPVPQPGAEAGRMSGSVL